jgi:hypothetical protein
MIPNPTPRQRFYQTQAHREALERWAVTKEAQAARDATLLEFIHRRNRKGNINEAWDEHSKLVGAQEALEILFSLHLPEPEAQRDRLPNIRPPQ